MISRRESCALRKRSDEGSSCSAWAMGSGILSVMWIFMVWLVGFNDVGEADTEAAMEVD